MNRNSTAIILVALAIGIYFTFTRGQITQAKAIKSVNDEYAKAIDNAVELIRIRDKVLADYGAISEDDQNRLDKMIPSTVDNIRLIIDLKDIALRHGFSLGNLKATAATPSQGSAGSAVTRTSGGSVGSGQVTGISNPTLDTVNISFSATAPYLEFISFLQDLEANLRIMDLTRLGVTAQDSGVYNFTVELKTYWLRQ